MSAAAVVCGIDRGTDERIAVKFEAPGTFEACHAAQRWCDEHGISYGPSDRYDRICLLYGDWHIAKWHNLTKSEQAECHGVMHGDLREGPVFIHICPDPRVAGGA